MGKLLFRVQKVRCTDETGGRWQEKIGSDDTYLAAVTVGADKSVEIIPAFHVRQFDDKTEKVFHPPKVLAEFDLSNGGNFPKRYFVNLVLIEKDSGKDIKPFLEKLKAKLEEGVGKADKVTNHGVTSSPEWWEIAKEVGIEVGKWAWHEFRKDDIFPPEQADVLIRRPDFTWPGGENHSQAEFTKFEAHKGKYLVKHDWMVTA